MQNEALATTTKRVPIRRRRGGSSARNTAGQKRQAYPFGAICSNDGTASILAPYGILWGGAENTPTYAGSPTVGANTGGKEVMRILREYCRKRHLLPWYLGFMFALEFIVLLVHKGL